MFYYLDRNPDLGGLASDILAELSMSPAMYACSILKGILSLEFYRTGNFLLCSSLNFALDNFSNVAKVRQYEAANLIFLSDRHDFMSYQTV